MFSEKKHDLNIKWKIDDYIISIFTDHQIRIMEEVLYDMDIDFIKQGLKQFDASYLEKWQLLKELGYLQT